MRWLVRSWGTNAVPFGPIACYEFQIREKDSGRVLWSCWARDFPWPHGFQVLTTESRKNFACLIWEGIHLFRLSESRESAEMRRQFWETPDEVEIHHPDALPRVDTGLLMNSLGGTNTLGLGPQAFNITVDKLSDAAGELRVTAHGDAPQPQCAFALRTNKWELVSTSGR